MVEFTSHESRSFPHSQSLSYRLQWLAVFSRPRPIVPWFITVYYRPSSHVIHQGNLNLNSTQTLHDNLRFLCIRTSSAEPGWVSFDGPGKSRNSYLLWRTSSPTTRTRLRPIFMSGLPTIDLKIRMWTHISPTGVFTIFSVRRLLEPVRPI